MDSYLVGGPCEGCEAIFEFGDRRIHSSDTLPGFEGDGPKLKIEGTAYLSDGKTPAPGVIIYVYQTDQTGIYPTKGNEKGWARRHGYIRGWIKTDVRGHYEFFTMRPASYPDRTEPQHIHATVLEPEGKYYWISSFLFADDPLLKSSNRQPKDSRGGNEDVLTLQRSGDLLIGKRDIILGQNVPGYDN